MYVHDNHFYIDTKIIENKPALMSILEDLDTSNFNDDITIYPCVICDIFDKYPNYDELKEILTKFNRIFGYDKVAISVRSALEYLLKYYYSLRKSNEKFLDTINQLIRDGVLVGFEEVLYGMVEFKFKLYKMYNMATNIGKAIISLMIYNDLKYYHIYNTYNQEVMVRYINFINLYDTAEEFLIDKEIHKFIIKQGFGDGTKSVKRMFNIKHNPYYYNNSDLVKTNEDVYTEFIKVIFELADEYNFNKRQINILYYMITDKRYQQDSNVFNELTRIPYIYGKREFFSHISEVNKRAGKMYAEMMLE